MINTRLFANGAVSVLAIMLAGAAVPVAAAAPPTLGMTGSEMAGFASDIRLPAVPVVAPIAEMQEQSRRGSRGSRTSTGRAQGAVVGRSGARSSGSYDGGSRRSQPNTNASGNRFRQNYTNNAEFRTAGPARPSRSYDRGSRNAAVQAPAPAPAREMRSQRRDNRGSFEGSRRGARDYVANPAANPQASPAYRGADNTGKRSRRADRAPRSQTNQALINERRSAQRFDYQAAPNYGEVNRGNSAAYATGNAADIPANTGAVRAGRQERGNLRGGSERVERRNDVAQRTGRGDRQNWRDDRRGDRQNWRDDRRGDRQNWRDGRRDGRQDWRDNRRGDRQNWRDNRRGQQFAYRNGFRDGARWDRGWRNNNRFNWIDYRRSNRFLFRPGPFVAPFSGHFYRPVGVGFVLDPLFFQPRFFLNDPWAFRLPPAGDRFRWVRYYDDVLLVDIFTGEVVDSLQNFFW